MIPPKADEQILFGILSRVLESIGSETYVCPEKDKDLDVFSLVGVVFQDIDPSFDVEKPYSWFEGDKLHILARLEHKLWLLDPSRLG